MTDGLIAPLNAPPGQLTPIGIQPGTTSPVVIANLVIIFGPAGNPVGLFVYQPGTIPGPGNPPVAWVSPSTADPYGNAIQPGIMLAQLISSGNAQGGLIWNTIVGSEPLLALFPNSTVGFTGHSPFVTAQVFNRGAANEQLALSLGGGAGSGVASPVMVNLFSVSKDGTLVAHISFYGGASGNLIADLSVNGLAAANPSVAGSIETWHPMALLNSWANVAGFATAKYRRVASPFNSVEIIGAINAAAATAATFFTLPANYIPASQQPVCSMGANAAIPAGLSPWIRCDASGNLAVQNTGAVPAAWQSFFHGFISLDA